MSYVAPTREMRFVIDELAGLNEICQLPGLHDATPDTAAAVLEECARLASQVIEPLNKIGDKTPPTYAEGHVTTPLGWRAAYSAYVQGGWQGLQHDPEWGGQGLPKLIAAACQEMINSANLSFALCPLLTDGAIEALLTAGSTNQQQMYLPKLISGQWAGTMNLTEPQAGSDLSLIKTKAVVQDNGVYRITGQKIFITYGEHDLAENIIHLVLARLPDAPAGIKGLSLFIVPKFLVKEDGSLGPRNDVYCASLEHKLGIKASPTAVMLYGENKGEVGAGALAYLVGEANRGLEYMFIMMNAARFAVGMQGVAIAQMAYQKAVSYAKDRVQSREPAGGIAPVAIIYQPDVRRMLMTMRALTEGARAVAYMTAAALDVARHTTNPAMQAQQQAFYEFMVPIVKGWSTEMSVEVASLGIQVHGGMGYIEETGVAQYWRDARILPIYEGTTAIQANDLLVRKTLRDSGQMVQQIAKQIEQVEQALRASDVLLTRQAATSLTQGRLALEEVVNYLIARPKAELNQVFAAAVPYLKLAGMVMSGWQLARSLLLSESQQKVIKTDTFYSAKVETARFFLQHILPQTTALRDAILLGGNSVLALPIDQF